MQEYQITCDLNRYEQHTVDDNGNPVDWINTYEGYEITGYSIENEESGELESFANFEEAKARQQELLNNK